ncbi:MAG: hypothetical protein II931_06055 [Clostridia bacterium]|nr:hypothetical protein [Clostridia bacterium]
MRFLNNFPKIFTSVSAAMFIFSMSVITALCVGNETDSSPETAMTGGNNTISIIIGIVLLAVGSVGFAVLKIREKEKS